MRNNVIVETERLIVRDIMPEDDQAMFEMDSDPEVHRYLGNRPVTDIQQSRNTIAYVLSQYYENGIGRWAVALKETNEFIGWTGFKLMREMVNNHVDHYDFGYRFMRKHWRQGLAKEASKASLEYGLDTLGIKDIYAMTAMDNTASRHLLERLGFKFVEIFSYDGTPLWLAGEPVTWYEYLE